MKIDKTYKFSNLKVLISLSMLFSACSPTVDLPLSTYSSIETPTPYVVATCEPIQSVNLKPTQDIYVQWVLDSDTNAQQYPRIPIPSNYDSTNREKREFLLRRLLTLWFEFQKTTEDHSKYAVRDYKIGKISQTQPRGNPVPEIAAFVELWFIPTILPNDFMSFPSEIPESYCSWWHFLQIPFAVYRSDGYFQLGLYNTPTP